MICRWYLVCKECSTVQGPFFSYNEAEKALADSKDKCAWLVVPQVEIPYPDVES